MILSCKACCVVLAAKLLVALVVLAAFWAHFNQMQFRSAYARWPQLETPNSSSRLSTWDSAHYLRLSHEGYAAGSRSCAFYPLWPATIRVATILTGGRPVLASTLLTNALSIVALWLFFRLVERRYGAALGRDALILMLAFPGALFFSFAYAESLYLLILMAFFLSLEAKRYWWVAVTCFLLPLARPVGVFILLPLAWHLYERYGLPGFGWRCQPSLRDSGGVGINAPNAEALGYSRVSLRDKVFPWLLVAFPLLGYAAYFGLMYLWTGNAFEGFEAQKAYPNSPSIKNMFNVAGFWNALANINSLDGMMDSAMDRGFFLLVLVLLPLVYRLDKTWFWYTLPAGIVPALTSWFMSYRRYIMVLFSIFIVLAQLLARTKNRWLFWYYVVLMAVLQAWAVKQFVNFNWAGWLKCRMKTHAK